MRGTRSLWLLVLLSSIVVANFSAQAAGSPPLKGAVAAAPSPARDSTCDGFGTYGYISERHNVSCASARAIAKGAIKAGKGANRDCGPRRTTWFRGWRIVGPVENGLTYRYSKGSHRFMTNKPTECKTGVRGLD